MPIWREPVFLPVARDGFINAVTRQQTRRAEVT